MGKPGGGPLEGQGRQTEPWGQQAGRNSFGMVAMGRTDTLEEEVEFEVATNPLSAHLSKSGSNDEINGDDNL